MANLENKILKDLYRSSNGLFAFTFYERYRISPQKFLNFVEKYKSKNIIFYDDKNGRITLMDEGKEFLQHRFITSNKRVNKYENIPRDFIAESLKINEPYLPDKSKLKEIL